MFCLKCGHQLANETIYCPICGTKVEKPTTVDQGQRRQVYAGEIRKCPNCGEPLSAFEIKCHSCGYELQNVKGSKAVAELAEAIAKLEATRPPQTKKHFWSSSNMSVSPTDRSIANIIQSFAIPNTREDILEFMILASANIDTDVLDSDNSSDKASQKLIANAWIAKFEQSYQKAKIAFGDGPEFNDIQVIYDRRQKEIRKGRTKSRRRLLIIILVYAVLMLFLFLMLNRPTSTKESAVQETSTSSQKDAEESIKEFKKSSEEFKEDMEEVSEAYKNIWDGYKSVFSGIFD